MNELIIKLYQSSKTIFSNQDLALLWGVNEKQNLYTKISYYVKQGVLIRLTRGVFTKNKDYNLRELANNIYTPSYISFETVLRDNGVIFQHYDRIFAVAKWSKIFSIGGHTIRFRKLKDSVLLNPEGVVSKDNYSIASLERAFLDMIYLFPNYYFDNLEPIDWEKCRMLVEIYNNKQLISRLNRYYTRYAQ